MNTTAVKTDNELIAEFMGFQRNVFAPKVFVVPNRFRAGAIFMMSQDFEFSTRWEWLMPVVERIDSLHSQYPYEVSELSEYTIFAKIDVVHKAVVEFIKWYNDQKK